MKLRNMSMVLLAAGLLSACGSAVDDVSDSVGLELGGVASKGRMKRADVKAYEVDADGRKGGSPVASTTTDATDASYALKFNGKKGATYVVEVTANANTREANEISGQDEPLPVGFVMRTAIVAPDATPTSPIQATITPFSEMAVKAAEGASGGFKPANIQQAVTTVATMIGFNPVEVDLSSDTDANKPKLNDLLKTVAAIAAGSTAPSGGADLSSQKTAFGCDGKESGEAVKCVVEKLAQSASLTQTKLSDSTVNSALSTAMAAAVPDSEVRTMVAANLACEANCTAPAPTVYTAVQAAKKLFADLRNTVNADLSAMAATTSSNQVANDSAYLQVTAMKSALDQAVMPLDMLNKQLTAISTCLTWQAETTPAVGASSVPYYFGDGGGYGCSVAQGRLGVGINFAARTANDGKVYRVRQTFGISPSVANSYTYAFKSGVFVYSDSGALSSSQSTPSADYASSVLGTFDAQSGVASGAGTFTLDRSSGVLSMSAATMPGRYQIASFNPAATSPTKPLTGDLNVSKVVLDVTFNANTSISGGNGTAAPALDGSFKVFGVSNTTDTPDERVSLTMNAALNVTNGDGKPTSLNVSKLEWSSSTAKLSGALELKDFAWDASTTDYSPTKLTFSGSLSNATTPGGTFVPFLTGNLSVTQTGWNSFNTTLPDSSTNSLGIGIAFSGTLTAPSRPVLGLTISAQGTNDSGLSTLSAQFKSTASGADKFAITLAANKSTGTLTLSESSSNLSMSWLQDSTSVDVKKGAETVATIDMPSKVITYKDRTFEGL